MSEHQQSRAFSPSLRLGVRALRECGALDLAERLDQYIGQSKCERIALSRDTEALIVDLSRVTTRAQLLKAAKTMPKIFGCTTYAVFLANSKGHTPTRRLIETNYPASWLVKYTLKGYASIDPVLKIAREWHDNFFWDELDTSDRRTARFLKDAARTGIGPGGFTAVHTLNGSWNIAVCVSAPVQIEEFRPLFEPRLDAFLMVSAALSEAFFRVNFLTSSDVKLRERELTYLVYLWNGGEREAYPFAEPRERWDLEAGIAKAVACRTFDQAVMLIASMGLLETPEFLLTTLISDLPETSWPTSKSVQSFMQRNNVG